MRDFRDETERAVWAAAFVRSSSDSGWRAGAAEQWADYVLDELRKMAKGRDPYRSVPERSVPEFVGAGAPPCVAMSSKDLINVAAAIVRKHMPEPPAPGECGDQSRLYYESLASELERWGRLM